MFEDYFKEEYGRDCLKNEAGFMLYSMNGRECHVADFYIKPTMRRSLEAKKLFSTVANLARENGCEFITGILTTGQGREHKVSRLLRCYLAMGFKIYNATNGQIVVGLALNE